MNEKANIIDVKVIWNNIINRLSEKYKFSYSGNNPYQLIINAKIIYIYLRNLTRAYPNHSFDVCRIQLHKTEKFTEIKNTDIPLLVLGYCEKYNTIASWQNTIVKKRLNDKKNVSLYSRFSEMIPIKNNEIRTFKLTNGDHINVVDFQNVDLLIFDTFKKLTEDNNFSIFSEIELYNLIREYLTDTSELNAIEKCISYFEEKKIEYSLFLAREIIFKAKIYFNLLKA